MGKVDDHAVKSKRVDEAREQLSMGACVACMLWSISMACGQLQDLAREFDPIHPQARQTNPKSGPISKAG